MVQKKVTESFPKQRAAAAAPSRTAEKRKYVKKSLAESQDHFPSSSIDEKSLETFRKALDTSSPQNLPGRETQLSEVKDFLSTHLDNKKPGSLYISGAPGTGKTAVVNLVLNDIRQTKIKTFKKSAGFYQIFVNCMCKQSAKEIYEVILNELKTPTAKNNNGPSHGSLKDKVEARLFTKSKNAYMIVIILDEMDQILKGSNEVLYSLFEWARSPSSRLILIGIANALDLTVRHLPFLHLNASPVKLMKRKGRPTNETDDGEGGDDENDSSQLHIQSMCKTMSFPPYQREDIEKIIQQRMEQVGQNIFNSTAIKFVAAKVAASTGDARKALHACKEAMVTVEKQEQQQNNAQRLQEDPEVEDNNSARITRSLTTPKKVCIRNDQIGIAAVSKVLQIKKDDGPLPLQQTTILAALLKVNRDAATTREPLLDGVNKAIPLSILYKNYRKICSLKGFSWIEESELPMVCEVLQDRSLLSVVSTGNTAVKKLSVGSRKFGSPSSLSSSSSSGSNGASKIGVLFDPRSIQSLVLQGDLGTLFS